MSKLSDFIRSSVELFNPALEGCTEIDRHAKQAARLQSSARPATVSTIMLGSASLSLFASLKIMCRGCCTLGLVLSLCMFVFCYMVSFVLPNVQN